MVPATGLAARLNTMLEASGKYRNRLDDIAWSLTECTPLLDSANIQPTDWEQMAELCVEHQQADAVIIVHGTDTLAYTSSALAFLLQGIDVPVIVTGAQKPLEAQGSDALDNLAGALLEAQQAQPGVWVYFNRRLMPGARAVKKDAIGFAGFDAPRLSTSFAQGATTQIDWQANRRPWDSIAVSCVQMVPGYRSSHLRALLITRPDALVLSLYGLGTLADQNRSLLDELRAAQKQGIVVAAISQCYVGRVDFSAYATASKLARMGVLNGRDITLEAAYTKLMVLFRLGYPIRQIKALFGQNTCYEMSD